MFISFVQAVTFTEVQFTDSLICKGAPQTIVQFNIRNPHRKTRNGPTIYNQLNPLRSACGKLPKYMDIDACCLSFTNGQSEVDEKVLDFGTLQSGYILDHDVQKFPQDAIGQNYCILSSSTTTWHIFANSNCVNYQGASFTCRENGEFTVFQDSNDCIPTNKTEKLVLRDKAIASTFDGGSNATFVTLSSDVQVSRIDWIAKVPYVQRISLQDISSLAIFLCISIACLLVACGLIFAIRLCIQKRQFLNYLLAATQLVWLTTLSLRLAAVYSAQGSSKPSLFDGLFDLGLGFSSLLTAFYTASFLLLFKKANPSTSVIVYTVLVLTHVILAGGVYAHIFFLRNPEFEKPEFFEYWHDLSLNLWIGAAMLWDLVPLFLVVKFLTSLSSKSWFERLAVIFNADMWFYVAVFFDLLCIFGFIAVSVILGLTTILGGDDWFVLLKTVAIVLQAFHNLLTVYLIRSVTNILQYQMQGVIEKALEARKGLELA